MGEGGTNESKSVGLLALGRVHLPHTPVEEEMRERDTSARRRNTAGKCGGPSARLGESERESVPGRHRFTTFVFGRRSRRAAGSIRRLHAPYIPPTAINHILVAPCRRPQR